MTRRKRTTDRSRGFTLIELLVIIAIIAIMITVGVVSLTAGKGAVRVKGATRDIYAAIRRARSTALVTQQPAIITYSTEEVDGEVMAKIEISSAKLMDSSIDRSKVETLTGEIPKWQEELVHIRKEEEREASRAKKGQELVHIRGKESDDSDGETGAGDAKTGEGETLEDILFAPIDNDVVKGMRLKVEMGDKFDTTYVEETRKPKISVFSNVDYILGRYKDAKAKEAAAASSESKTESNKDSKLGDAGLNEKQEPVSVVWETNGRVDPHMVWVYADGQKPEEGLLLRIDRFGAVKVLSGDGKEDDDR